MSVSVSTTSDNTVSVSVGGSTSVSFIKKNFSVSASLSAASSTILTEKSIGSIQVVV